MPKVSLLVLVLLSLLAIFPQDLVFGLDARILSMTFWGGTHDDFGYGVTRDASGNIYLTGETFSFEDLAGELFIVKLNSTASLVWQRTWRGLDGAWGARVAVDMDGNVYVAGCTKCNGASDALILKLNSTGSLVWARTWGGQYDDSATSLTLDLLGNVVVAGLTEMGSGQTDAFILEIAPAGELLWQRTWGGGGYDSVSGVALDAAGNIYLVGQTSSFDAQGDLFLLKFTSSGDIVWQRIWGGAARYSGSAITLTPQGEVYVTGGTGANRGVILLKFSSDGTLIWQRIWRVPGEEVVSASGLAVNSSGNIFVTGYFAAYRDAAADVLLLGFDPTGALVLQSKWGGAGSDRGRDISIDAGGNPLVTGYGGPAPPTLGTLRIPVTISTSSVGIPSLPVMIPSGDYSIPNGDFRTPDGSTTYSGRFDAFVFEFSATGATGTNALTTDYLPLIVFGVALAASGVLLASRLHKRGT